jgi:molybdopterin synthase sulfur carrier subunit
VRVEVLYFAGLREAVGTARERVELPEGVATAAALRAHLRARGAEVAFFPPVTGG